MRLSKGDGEESRGLSLLTAMLDHNVSAFDAILICDSSTPLTVRPSVVVVVVVVEWLWPPLRLRSHCPGRRRSRSTRLSSERLYIPYAIFSKKFKRKRSAVFCEFRRVGEGGEWPLVALAAARLREQEEITIHKESWRRSISRVVGTLEATAVDRK